MTNMPGGLLKFQRAAYLEFNSNILLLTDMFLSLPAVPVGHKKSTLKRIRMLLKR